MKKLNILLLVVSMFSLGLLTTSCGKDFLERTPEHSYTADTYYSSDEAVMKAIEPLYNYAWFNYNYRAMVGMGSARANDGWNPYLNPQFATFQVTGLDGDLANAWKSFYLVVSMSNQLISDINSYCTDAVSEDAKNLALGEAYLMRGTAYFYLLRSWGDVIVYEDNLSMTQTPVVPLTKEEDVLKFVIRDYRRAVELLPVGSNSNHATKYAAEGLLAKALLAQSGWNKTTRDQATLDEVIELCDDIINNSSYALMVDYADLFKYDHNNFTMQNSETLLAMHWADPLTASWGTYNANFSDLGWSGSTDVNVWGGIYASVDMLDLYNEDVSDSIRFQATWCSPGVWYGYWDSGNDLVESKEKTKANGYPQAYGFVYNKKHCQLKKWVVGTKADCSGHLAQMASPLNTYIMRLADVYLIKAEAVLGNDDTTSDPRGLAAINAIRARAKVDEMYTSYGFEELIKERRKEFCMEFNNWYDMVTWYRWKPQYMLNYFNNKQHRAFMINQGDVLYNEDRSISYRAFPNRQTSPWYFYDDTINPRGCYWNDCMREGDTENVLKTKEQGYVYDVDALARAQDGYDPVTLNETNIFMPYPEADVIRNPYFKEPAQNYDFGDE
jgi:hypothetical protein